MALNSAIKIYCRIKPTTDPIISYDIMCGSEDKERESNDELLELTLREDHPPLSSPLYLNNKPEQYKFRFNKVFDRSSRQDYIFQNVARPVIDSALQGYNGTIFAYGQTGTGKTFTMTGSRTEYENRGILPRTLEYIFMKFDEDNSQCKVRNVYVSYLEIYNEAGYDLLNPSSMSGRMDDLGRVSLMEDGSQQMHLRNLSVHSIESVEEATQFLYLGDHNRTIAETPLNEVSTRSHCIFTIHLNMRDVSTSLTTRSKLHLVDLAGSERVSTISTSSQLATEARHINLALHYLEQVIVALGDTNRSHIPYRNSMMTSVLRDSLGGNCMTSMIATISLSHSNIQETLSTCRFAQRVALVTNAVQRNEDFDPNIIISQLKKENKKLREQLESQGIRPVLEHEIPLSDDEVALCSYKVKEFLVENESNSPLPIPSDMRMVQECFRIMKCHLSSARSSSSSSPMSPMHFGTMPKYENHEYASLIKTTKMQQQLLARRDAEIKVLMDMLRKSKKELSQSAMVPHSQNSSEMSIPEDTSHENEASENEMPIKISSPPPSRDPPLQEDIVSGEDYTGSKRVALINFTNEYHKTEYIEKLRSHLFQKRHERQEIEASINSGLLNHKSLKKIVASGFENGLDVAQLGNALNSQEKTLEMQEERMRGVENEIELMENELRSEYKKLLAQFQLSWNEKQKMGESEEVERTTATQSSFPEEVSHVFKKEEKVNIDKKSCDDETSEVPSQNIISSPHEDSDDDLMRRELGMGEESDDIIEFFKTRKTVYKMRNEGQKLGEE